MTDLGRFTLLAGGARFYVNRPDHGQISLEELALGLSRSCRFNGQFWHYPDDIYSVAQHSVLVDDLVKGVFDVPEARPWAIAHDLSEGIIGDLITPVKVHCPEFNDIEERLAAVLNERFRVPMSDRICDIVRQADAMACAMEAEELSGIDAAEWGLKKPPFSMRQFYPDFRVWRPLEARQRFISRFRAVVSQA